MSVRYAALVATLFLSSPLFLDSSHAEGSLSLPELGNSASTTFTDQEEKQTGLAVMVHLKRAGLLIDNPFLTTYLTDLGYHLVPHANDAVNEYTFFLVNDDTINAFALPGGYIGVHAGLILATRNEDELAAVIAHEIAHVSQHHLARRFEQAEGMNLTMAAALIAAILVGGDNPQLAQAAIATSSALSSQKQLDFSRDNEHEADRVGIQILADANYAPSSMASFFERLQSESRYYTNPPEFLSTHPVTENRIADAMNRANQYPKKNFSNDIGYARIKAILEVETAKDINKLESDLSHTLDSGNDKTARMSRFRYALILEKNGKLTKAHQEFEKLARQEPENLHHLYHLAQLADKLKMPDESERYYKKGLSIYPTNSALVLAYARHLTDRRQYADAQDYLNAYLRQAPNNSAAFQLLAEVEHKAGNKHASQLALAEHYYLEHEIHSAIDQLELALRDPGIDYYNASRIEARLKQLQDEAKFFMEKQ